MRIDTTQTPLQSCEPQTHTPQHTPHHRFGGLDVALLCAGIGERGDFLDASQPTQALEKTLDIDLTAVIAGTRLVAQSMIDAGRGGRIISIASAAGGGGGCLLGVWAEVGLRSTDSWSLGERCLLEGAKHAVVRGHAVLCLNKHWRGFHSDRVPHRHPLPATDCIPCAHHVALRPCSLFSASQTTGIFPVHVAPYYAAAKGGLVHFTRSLASRLAPHGIQLATICPQCVLAPHTAAQLR